MMLRNFFIALAIGTIAFLLPACWPSKKVETSAEQATPRLHVINVLSEALYNDAHIPGSQSVPMDKINDFAATMHKDDEIVVYCANYMCTASAAAAQQLKDKGFNKVYAYEAGMADWAQKGLPVEGPAKSSYLATPSRAPQVDHENSIEQVATQELYDKMVNAGLIKVPAQSAHKETSDKALHTVSVETQTNTLVKE